MIPKPSKLIKKLKKNNTGFRAKHMVTSQILSSIDLLLRNKSKYVKFSYMKMSRFLVSGHKRVVLVSLKGSFL